MSVLRKILGLPQKAVEGGDDTDPEAAAEIPRTTGAGRADTAAGWDEERESSGRSAARKAGRFAIWAVICLAALTGVRTWVFPAQQPAPVTQADPQAEARKTSVSEPEAQQVAARFARSYMTWNSQAPQGRERELAADLAKGADPKMGWDGSGTQLVAQTIPGPVTRTGYKRATVLVDVRVSVTSGPPGKETTVTSWRGLSVPVAESGGRVLVSGQPALVGLPGPVDYTAAAQPESDSALSASTRDTLKTFLAAWAAGTQDQAAAPGAAIAPLGPGITLDALDSWAVDAGTGERRTGTATLRWSLGGARLQQTYRITLTQVSAATATRWQVQAVAAAG